MKVNIAGWDRFLRYLFGFFLTLWGTAGGPWWTWVGVYLIMTSSWGLCPIYSYFNTGTTHEEKENWNSVLKTLQVDYLKALEERIELLSNLTNKKDVENLEAEYHKLKGTGKTYGFPAVSIVCDEMEKLTRFQKAIPDHLLNAGPTLLKYCLESFRSTGPLNLDKHPDFISLKNATKESFLK